MVFQGNHSDSLYNTPPLGGLYSHKEKRKKKVEKKKQLTWLRQLPRHRWLLLLLLLFEPQLPATNDVPIVCHHTNSSTPIPSYLRSPMPIQNGQLPVLQMLPARCRQARIVI